MSPDMVACHLFSNHSTAADPGALWDDDNPIPDAVVPVILLLQVVRVYDGDVVADSNVFINNGIDDRAVIADPDVRQFFRRVLLQLLGRLKVISSHNNGVLDGRTSSDTASNADNRVFDVGAVKDTAIRNDGLVNVAIVQL